MSARYTYHWGWLTLEPYVQIINVYDQPNVLLYDVHARPHTSIPFLPLAGLDARF